MPSYPTTTTPRRAYDADGSGVFVVDGAVSTPVDPTDVAELNSGSEGGGVAVGTNDWLAIIFPVRVTIGAMFLAHAGTSDTTLDIETSADSTDGADGAWDAQGSIAVKRGDTVADGATWRSDLIGGLSFQCRGIRVAPGTTRWQNWLIHGSGGQGSGLKILSSAYAAFSGGLYDWGAVARASSDDVEVYVQNPTSRDATGVVLSVQDVEGSGDFAVQHYLSSDARNFASAVNLGLIAAGSRSGRVTVRRVTPSGATTGAQAARLVAAAAGWE